MDGQGTKWRRKIVKNFSRLSKVHERYRQTDRQTTDRRRDGRQQIANVNVAKDALPNTNRTQAANIAENAVFVPDNLDLCP